MAYIKRGIEEIIMNKTIIFDLDGTLTDSKEGILKSLEFALEAFGYDIPPYETQWTTYCRFLTTTLWDDYRAS